MPLWDMKYVKDLLFTFYEDLKSLTKAISRMVYGDKSIIWAKLWMRTNNTLKDGANLHICGSIPISNP